MKMHGGPAHEWASRFDRRRPSTTAAERAKVHDWFIGNLVDNWFVAEPEIVVDDYEILVIGMLADEGLESAEDPTIAARARIERFREDTRARRIEIALGAEREFSRKVSWGARIGEVTSLFTTASVPAMTRLNLSQRQTLDTLVEAGVARSKSEALSWCVELVRRNETEWIERLREALRDVEQARAEGPASS